jgi:glycosyltransferase involved in cell wall biosynthesis
LRAIRFDEVGSRVKIAQVAPLFESVPPKRYGGTERVVSYLTEELVELGHDVTLFASGDSTTEARLFRHARTHCGWIPDASTRWRTMFSCLRWC